ncbi:glutathione peroxidase [Glaciecola sp. 2405UD65-10]|uniref:glutathione peroxidase n=1 Tax=Glaciecola sp. 2405UD65-10 TaxID=3397244 RepID=UPI003B5AEFAB
MSSNLHSLAFTSNKGVEVALSDFTGKVVLFVNTASKCGYTPQYEGLESLYQKYNSQGFEIIGFPCDQFAGQEPGSDVEIEEFCQLNFGVSFPLSTKVDVNGNNTHPIFEILKNDAPGILGTKRIKWNFTKFLVGKDGRVIKRFATATKPAALSADIEKALQSA